MKIKYYFNNNSTRKQFRKINTKSNLIHCLKLMKDVLENTIKTSSFTHLNGAKKGKLEQERNGLRAKGSLIRSQDLIYLLHRFVKEELVRNGFDKKDIFPHIGSRKNETPLYGFFKCKKQDVCYVPDNKKIQSKPCKPTWCILGGKRKSRYGRQKESKILATNVRSQLSSVEKNTDTLFERMIAEAFNLHKEYPKLVLGELYLIPVYEYENNPMKKQKIRFSHDETNLEGYIKFFDHLSNYNYKKNKGETYQYDQDGLIIADFRKNPPKIYTSTKQLKADNLVSKKFSGSLKKLSAITYVKRLSNEYKKRYPKLC